MKSGKKLVTKVVKETKKRAWRPVYPEPPYKSKNSARIRRAVDAVLKEMAAKQAAKAR